MKTYEIPTESNLAIIEGRIDVAEALEFEPSKQAKLSLSDNIKLEANAFFELPVKTRKWRERYLELVEFKNREGHCVVPFKKKVLYRWVSEQREGTDKLHPEQVRQLLDIQFPFRKGDRSWFTSWRDLQDYQRANGSASIADRKERFFELAKWCYLQRSRKKAGWLTPHQEFLLNELNFEWDGFEAQWQRMYAQARQYYTLFGNWRIQARPDLRRWFKAQRKSMFTMKIRSQHKALLDAINFPWMPLNASGEETIPGTWPDENLTSWLARQRSAHKRHARNAELRTHLDNMAMGDPRMQRMWNHRMNLLREFYRQAGHCRVPRYHKLARFVRVIRKAYAEDRLHPRQLQDLRGVGFEKEIFESETLAELAGKLDLVSGTR